MYRKFTVAAREPLGEYARCNPDEQTGKFSCSGSGSGGGGLPRSCGHATVMVQAHAVPPPLAIADLFSYGGSVRAPRALTSCKSEKDAKLAQKLGQLQPFIVVFPQECMGQLASFGPT